MIKLNSVFQFVFLQKKILINLFYTYSIKNNIDNYVMTYVINSSSSTILCPLHHLYAKLRHFNLLLSCYSNYVQQEKDILAIASCIFVLSLAQFFLQDVIKFYSLIFFKQLSTYYKISYIKGSIAIIATFELYEMQFRPL